MCFLGGIRKNEQISCILPCNQISCCSQHYRIIADIAIPTRREYYIPGIASITIWDLPIVRQSQSFLIWYTIYEVGLFLYGREFEWIITFFYYMLHKFLVGWCLVCCSLQKNQKHNIYAYGSKIACCCLPFGRIIIQKRYRYTYITLQVKWCVMVHK